MNTYPLEREELCRYLPHRPPFLFVDRIVRKEESRIAGEITFRAEESFFEGHYPGHPVVPGVLLIEAAAQTAAVFTGMEGYSAGKTGYLAKVEDMQFKAPVKPGDRLECEVYLERVLGDFLFFSSTVRKGDVVVAKGKFTVVVKDDRRE
ncbi:3-hydroxyacyl-ACP dehydratase FabZ [Paenibacillus thailandensis]|uniref:3-hydroxyacyl-ACP dehydratase FabZ n=1 Tax=Paenibacillus thailandensis TaxID=393250 RepID=A0ABW5R2Z1_9BACL